MLILAFINTAMARWLSRATGKAKVESTKYIANPITRMISIIIGIS
jgi:hypothetical protein